MKRPLFNQILVHKMSKKLLCSAIRLRKYILNHKLIKQNPVAISFIRTRVCRMLYLVKQK